MAYTYSIVKFVPDAARREAVNLGAVAGSDESGDWEFRGISNFIRARALDDRNALPGALAFLSEIEDRIAEVDTLMGERTQMSATLLETWAGEMRNIVQFTPPAPVVATSAAEALDIIFDQLVVDPGRREFRFEKKYRAVSSTVAAYQRMGVPDAAVVRRVSVRAANFADSFDVGVANGQVVQLVKCWSFQLPDQSELAEQVKAWAWLVERVRESGGQATVGDHTYELPSGDSDLAVVYVAPSPEADSPAFLEAMAAFQTLHIEGVDATQADFVARRAAERLASNTGTRRLWSDPLA
jgi:hypothetical protein